MKKKKNIEEKVLDVNATMQGSLIFSDPVNLRINGKFQGTLNTKGTLHIGEPAEVSADINGENISIAGKVKGTIISEKKLELLSTAVVQGDIHTPCLAVQEGAVFEGKVRMIGETMELRDVSRYLDIEEDKILEWASSGKIPGIREGDKWFFEKRRLENWVKTAR